MLFFFEKCYLNVLNIKLHIYIYLIIVAKILNNLCFKGIIYCKFSKYEKNKYRKGNVKCTQSSGEYTCHMLWTTREIRYMSFTVELFSQFGCEWWQVREKFK